jgi:hypothetical protein
VTAGIPAGQLFLFEDGLPERLRGLGLSEVDRVLTHTNTTVMLSLNRRTLRLHRGYAFAPDEVLKAIVQFLNPRVPRVRRRAAEREFLEFPAGSYVVSPHRRDRRERSRPGDITLLRRLGPYEDAAGRVGCRPGQWPTDPDRHQPKTHRPARVG